jgi:sodium/potassium-transporting ATPase subunit alpha
MQDFYSHSSSDVLQALGTTTHGLSQEEAHRRFLQYGPNKLPEGTGFPLAQRLVRQFTHFLAILLWVAAGLAFLAETLKPGEGMATLGGVILGVIVLNAVFSFVQEFKAERAVQALRRLLPVTVWVLRGGQPHQISHFEVVPGDVLLLENGTSSGRCATD